MTKQVMSKNGRWHKDFLHGTLRKLEAELVVSLSLVKIKIKTVRESPLGVITLDNAADLAQELTDQSVTLSESEIYVKKAVQIDEAIKKIKADLISNERHEYGLCMGCDEPILVRRLAIVPWARMCVPCQEKNDLEEAEN